MIISRIFSFVGPIKGLSIFTVFAFLLICFSTSIHAADNKNTLFLPVKITSLSKKSDTLAADADRALTQALSHKGYTLLKRSDAEKLLNYQGEWPPKSSQLKTIKNFAEYENLAIGSLTILGNQLSLDFKIFDLLSARFTEYYNAKGNDLAELDTLYFNLVSEMLSFTERESLIASISPAGNSKIDSGAILKSIRTKPGDYYNPAALRQDLKAIYQMGYFDDIQIEVVQGKKGKEVLFRITEKPVIRLIVYSGIDELKEENVKEVVTIEEQSILNPAKIKSAGQAIQLLYKSKGYYNTQVSPKISYPSKDSAEVRFIIDEGKKIYIKKIAFEGNTTFDDGDLEDEIETDTKGWFSWLLDTGLLDYDKLNQDAGRIINFYGNQGFLEAKISDPIVTQEEEWLFITFAIEEGTRFKVGQVDIKGDLLDDKEKLLTKLSMAGQDYISRKILREDILKLNDLYAEKGYANASIRPLIQKSDTKDKLDIVISIEKGELVYINRINIKGNTRTRDNVIRRELKVAEGGIFNVKALRESVQKLQYLDFFDEVSINPQSSFNKSTMDLNVDVKDKSTGQFTIGAGYSSVDHLILMGEVAENNFLGRGDTLAFSANVGGESNKYSIRYKNPHLNDSELSWGLDLFDMNREYDDYTKDSKGGALNFGYPIWEKIRGYGGYSYTDTTLSDVDDDASYVIRNSQDIHVTSAVKLTLQRDSRNRRFGATKGSRNSLSVRYAGGPLGGDSQFTKVEGSTSWYFPVFLDTVFHFKTAAGQVFENENDSLPVYERFYLGGLNSIRGFKYAKISPRDEKTDERIGGDKRWFSNFEYIFPLLAEQGLNGVIFYDIGNVYNDDEDWSLDDYRSSAGMGIRWFSPMGPLRLEWGYNLDPQDDEDQSEWDFSIGGVF